MRSLCQSIRPFVCCSHFQPPNRFWAICGSLGPGGPAILNLFQNIPSQNILLVTRTINSIALYPVKFLLSFSIFFFYLLAYFSLLKVLPQCLFSNFLKVMQKTIFAVHILSSVKYDANRFLVHVTIYLRIKIG